MKTNQIADQLAAAALQIACAGAQNYLQAHNYSADPATLDQCLASWLKLKLPEALEDAKQAFDCNMQQIGVATFTASLMQAGIEAAKECAYPKAA